MTSQKLIGVVLFVVGLVLLYFGWQSSETFGEQLKEGVTGRFTDKTMWYLIGGIAAAVGGAFLLLFRK